LAGEEPLDPVAPVEPLPGVDTGLLVDFGVAAGVLGIGVVTVVVLVVVFVCVLVELPDADWVDDEAVLGTYSRNGFGSAPCRVVAGVLVVSSAASS
jgi:hypothetical protein